MIYKNQLIGISEDVTVAEFGTGDIIVHDGHEKLRNIGAIMLTQSSPEEIGTEHPERTHKGIEENKYDIMFTFTSTDSIDIVVEALLKTKQAMLNHHD